MMSPFKESKKLLDEEAGTQAGHLASMRPRGQAFQIDAAISIASPPYVAALESKANFPASTTSEAASLQISQPVRAIARFDLPAV